MTSAMGFVLPLAAVAALFGSLCMQVFSLHTAPLIQTSKHGLPTQRNPTSTQNQHCLSTVAATGRATTALLLSLPNEFQNKNSQDPEMLDQAPVEEKPWNAPKESEQMPPPAASQKRVDPLIASLTRVDKPTRTNVPTTTVPFFGEIPADGNLALLVPAAVIGVLGLIFSIIVALNSRDVILHEMLKVELPKMEYTPTKVTEGQCRGLCSRQEDDLDGLRNFMDRLRKD